MHSKIAESGTNDTPERNTKIMFNVGESVEWASQGYWAMPSHIHRGEVIEIVEAGAKPTKAGNWDFAPRKKRSYVVSENGKTFWPRVDWIRKLEG